MMPFDKAITTCLENYIEFEGRASRAEFWWFALFRVLVVVGCEVLSRVILASGLSSDLLLRLGAWLPGLAAIALFFPSIAVGARRLHDIGRTGWWQLLLLIPPLIIILVVFWVLPPKREDNKHGPYIDPAAPIDLA